MALTGLFLVPSFVYCQTHKVDVEGKFKIQERMQLNSGSNPLNLPVANSVHVTSGSVWTDAFSRSFKENNESLSLNEVLLSLDQLVPVTNNNIKKKEEEYLGFIAEDVPELVTMKDRESLSPMDIVTILTRVVQDEKEAIEKQEYEIEEQKYELKNLWKIIEEVKK